MTPRKATPHAKCVGYPIGLRLLFPLAALSLLAACDDLQFMFQKACRLVGES